MPAGCTTARTFGTTTPPTFFSWMDTLPPTPSNNGNRTPTTSGDNEDQAVPNHELPITHHQLMNAIRMIDVARRLRIPRTTVSAAFHTTKLRPELQQRILSAAQDMGYRPHRYAQVMRRGKTGLIGIVRSNVPASTRVKLDI